MCPAIVQAVPEDGRLSLECDGGLGWLVMTLGAASLRVMLPWHPKFLHGQSVEAYITCEPVVIFCADAAAPLLSAEGAFIGVFVLARRFVPSVWHGVFGMAAACEKCLRAFWRALFSVR